MKNISELAKANNLETINVGTSYGLHEYDAIVGFKSFSEAIDFADENKLKIAAFKKEISASNYQLDDDAPRSGFDVLSHYENYTKFFKGDEQEFEDVDINETIESMDFDSEQEKSEWLENMREIKDRIANLKDGEFIYLDNSGVYSDVLKVEDTFDTHDGNSYVIGVYE